MITFTTGFPPGGNSAHITESGSTIPEPLRGELCSVYESAYPEGYIAVGVDPDAGIIGLYHRTSETWKPQDDIEGIFLRPTLPAKGPGMIELSWSRERVMYPDGFLWVRGYSEAMHLWIQSYAVRIAELIGCEFNELESYHDC